MREADGPDGGAHGRESGVPAIEETIAPVVLTTITDWVVAHTN